jgi:hypothetical protein
VPMRVIAKKRCRAMVEPPEKGERATLNPNLSTRPKPTFFPISSWAGAWPLLAVEGKRRGHRPIIPLDNLLTRFQAQLGNQLQSQGSSACGLICWLRRGWVFRPFSTARFFL